jgi:hypothetical protein
VRNQFYLPHESSSIITEEYLQGIVDGKRFDPRYPDIPLLAAPSLPTKDVLIAKLQLVSKEKKWNLGIDEVCKPDKAWLVNVLSTYLPGDEIFAKAYRAPPVKAKKEEEKTVKLPGDLLQSLPEARKTKRVRRSKLKILKDGKAK